MDLKPVGIHFQRLRRGIVVASKIKQRFKLRQERNVPPRRGWGIGWARVATKISLLTELSDGARPSGRFNGRIGEGVEKCLRVLTDVR